MRDGMRMVSINKAIEIASKSLANGHIEIADIQLEKAYKLCLETRFPRHFHTELITAWGLIGIKVGEMGFPELATHCQNMYNLLQARFKAGDYYPDSVS